MIIITLNKNFIKVFLSITIFLGNIDLLLKCAKESMKKYQFRKYKEVYQVNIDIIKFVIENCAKFHKLLDNTIEKHEPKNLENKKIFMYIEK